MRGLFLVVVALLGQIVTFSRAMNVDLYVHKDKFGKSLNLDIGGAECTNVPRLWANLTMSVDTHGSCMQFYDGKSCKGKIAVIQPFHTVHQMDLSLIQFHNTIQSISPCGAKVPTGRYVIQSAVDASILTVQKHENEFARVNTLPPTAFIPKAQQWEISEKQPNEFDIMPRIHETNYPITYDGDAMKRGSFIRKVWKIESVGRGRYVIKSEWTQKCLYKTRIRTVEEHDCRAWSPNQEWVLRPLIAPTKPPPTADPQLADGVNFQVPSKVVDKYLAEQKRLREKNRIKNRPQQDEDGDDGHIGAYLEPYRIRYKKNKNKNKETQQDDNSSEEEGRFDRLRQGGSFGGKSKSLAKPPGPEVMYSRPSPIFNKYEPRPHGPGHAPKEMVYMDGVMPIFQDAKVDDPVFPDFLLHAAAPEEDEEEAPPLKYTVTRRPFKPEPEGHPDYVPDKKKYDGRVKDKKEEQADEESEEENENSKEEDDQEDEPAEGHFNDQKGTPGVTMNYDRVPEQGGPPSAPKPQEEEESQEDEEESQEDNQNQKKEEPRPPPHHLSQVGYQSGFQEIPATPSSQKKKPINEEESAEESREESQEDQEEQPSQGPPPPQGYQGYPEIPAATTNRKPSKSKKPQEEEESLENQEQDDNSQEQKLTLEDKKKLTQKEPVKVSGDELSAEEGDDPARDVASFMKLLFKGINDKMNKKEKVQTDMADLLERRRK